MGTNWCEFILRLRHNETTKFRLELHWSHCNKLRVTVRRRTESSISLYELPVDFLHPSANWVSFVHVLGVSKPIKAFLLNPRHPNHLMRKVCGPQKFTTPKHPPKHPYQSVSKVFWDVLREIVVFVFFWWPNFPTSNTANPPPPDRFHRSGRFFLQERSGSESSFVTSLAGSLPKVRPRDVLTGVGGWCWTHG